MTAESATIVQKLWNYCNGLRDDGMSYGDYIKMEIGSEHLRKSIEHYGKALNIMSKHFEQ